MARFALTLRRDAHGKFTVGSRFFTQPDEQAGRMQNLHDHIAVQDYAREFDEYGGTFHDGDVLVVLFTKDQPEHEDALRSLVQEPELLSVRLTDRSWKDVAAAQRTVEAQLLGPVPHPEVRTVGIGTEQGRFVINIGIDPYSQTRASELQAALAPIDVQVLSRKPARWLSNTARAT